MEQNPNTEITVATGRQVLWNSHHIAESEKLHKAAFYDYKNPLCCQVNKIVAELPNSDIAAEIANKNHCRLQGYRGENWYAFLPENSGKIQAILELAKSLNIFLSDIVSFGDDINDMEMLQICGMGVAVSNAVTEVKDVADCVTLSNDEDGVADMDSPGFSFSSPNEICCILHNCPDFSFQIFIIFFTAIARVCCNVFR